MGLARGISRATPLVAGGLAAGWYLRRQAKVQQVAGSSPLMEEPAPPGPKSERPAPGAQRREAEEPLDAHLDAVEAVSDAADITSVIEDLLAAAPGEQPELLDGEGDPPSPA